MIYTVILWVDFTKAVAKLQKKYVLRKSFAIFFIIFLCKIIIIKELLLMARTFRSCLHYIYYIVTELFTLIDKISIVHSQLI